jgi:hypothetical protein
MAENSDRNREDIFKRANAYLNEIPDLRTDRRANKLSILDRIRAAASKLESSAAQQLQELVKIGDLNGAEMLARKFEASCPEDAASLQDDLALLKEIEKEDGTDASK